MKKSDFTVCVFLAAAAAFVLFFSCSGEVPVPEQDKPQEKEETAAAALPEEVPGYIDTSLPANTITLRVAYDDPQLWPETSAANVPDPQHAYAVLFQDYVERASGGKIKVERFGGKSLGSYRETLEMVHNGSLDVSIGNGELASLFPRMELIAIPYVFGSDDIAEEFFNTSPLWAGLMDDMEKETGFKYLSIGRNGWRNFTNNSRPIKSPEDCAGLTFCVPENSVVAEMMRALGASGVPVPPDELYTTLQLKIAGGAENTAASVVRDRIYEVQKYITMDGHIWSENIMVMNPGKYNDLPVGVQQIISAGAKLGAQANNVSERMFSNVVKFDLIARHMEVYTPSAAEKQRFREAAQPAVIEYLRENLGAELVDDFLKEVQLAEARSGWRR